jgi:hypothetical protein
MKLRPYSTASDIVRIARYGRGPYTAATCFTTVGSVSTTVARGMSRAATGRSGGHGCMVDSLSFVGTFLQTALNTWEERLKAGSFKLDERKRDDVTVELFDSSRSAKIQFDFVNRTIKYSPANARDGRRDRYYILSAVDKANSDDCAATASLNEAGGAGSGGGGPGAGGAGPLGGGGSGPGGRRPSRRRRRRRWRGRRGRRRGRSTEQSR